MRIDNRTPGRKDHSRGRPGKCSETTDRNTGRFCVAHAHTHVSVTDTVHVCLHIHTRTGKHLTHTFRYKDTLPKAKSGCPIDQGSSSFINQERTHVNKATDVDEGSKAEPTVL